MSALDLAVVFVCACLGSAALAALATEKWSVGPALDLANEGSEGWARSNELLHETSNQARALLDEKLALLSWLLDRATAVDVQIAAIGDQRDIGYREAIEDAIHWLTRPVPPGLESPVCPTCGATMVPAKIAIPFPGQHPDEVAYIDGPPTCPTCRSGDPVHPPALIPLISDTVMEKAHPTIDEAFAAYERSRAMQADNDRRAQ